MQTMTQAEVDVGNSLVPHATLLMSPRCPTVSIVTPHVGKKLSLKVDLAVPSLASYIVSGQYLSVAMLCIGCTIVKVVVF